MSPSSNNFRRRIIAGLTLVAFTAAGFFGGIVLAPRLNPEGSLAASLTLFSNSISSEQPDTVDMTPLWKAWHLLDERFVPATTTLAIDDQERLWGAIAGVANAHGDPHTIFLPPVENKIFNEDISGSFAGVGMEIGMRDHILTVIAPLKDSPAERAGLLAGDFILAVNSTSTDGLSTEEAVSLIRGEKGTDVTLLVYTEGDDEPHEVTITRDTIKIPTIDSELRDDGIFVISLYNFGATSPNEFRAALREFVLTGSDKLILDLRNNPGGFLEAAVEMGSWFLPAGDVIAEEYFGEGKDSQYHRSKGYNIFANEDLKMAILVNQGSASASEILSGALKEHGVAVVVGRNTFGKGSVQELIPLTSDPETSLKITIAQWRTPEGHSISDGGLTPDIAWPPSATTTATSTMSDLIIEEGNAALDPKKDRVLERAVLYLENEA